MDYDVLDGVPCHVLGRTVKTRTQIFLSILLPACLELIVYLFLTTADAAVAYQHFHDGNKLFGILTLTFLCLPALVCFCSIITSAWHWPEQEGCGRDNWIFFGKNFLNLIIFPIGAIYRYGRRIFWSIEALFHDKEFKERRRAVRRAFENSPFELYHFCQAFFQAAPQIMLQLYHMLRQDIFQNFQTTTAQAFSLVFSFITMGIIISSYQRFESQKCVGRNYPWYSQEQVEYRQRHLRRTKSILSDRSTTSQSTPIIEYPNITLRFDSRYNDLSGNQNENSFRRTISNVEQFSPLINQRKTLNVDKYNFQAITDDEKIQNTSKVGPPSPESNLVYDELDSEPRRITGKRVTYNIDESEKDIKRPTSENSNFPDDDLIEHIDEIKSFINKTDGRLPLETSFDDIEPYPSVVVRRPETPDDFDSVPKTPAPPTPAASEHHKSFGLNAPFKRISLFKDMLLQNTEMYIKEHVPRLPSKFYEDDEKKNSSQVTTTQAVDGTIDVVSDEPDFPLPTRRTIIEGIEQDDFFGKMISFMGWGLFLLMRMLSLSVFSVFYLIPTLHILYAHYILMVICLFYETRFHEKIERIFFYFFLGYIYIFSILEFKIKFKHLRQWYIGYVGFVFLQNLIITLVWYGGAEFSSWWFHYLFAVIIGSGVLSIGCLLFYYILLKPRNKLMLENK